MNTACASDVITFRTIDDLNTYVRLDGDLTAVVAISYPLYQTDALYRALQRKISGVWTPLMVVNSARVRFLILLHPQASFYNVQHKSLNHFRVFAPERPEEAYAVAPEVHPPTDDESLLDVATRVAKSRPKQAPAKLQRAPPS